MRKTIAPKRFMVLLAALLLSLATMAQQKTVSGKITDPDGEPLSGVTIAVKGGASTQTAPDGSFTIRASESDVLEISSVGFEPQNLIVGKNNTLSFSLNRTDVKMDEVVVVGYGTQSRRNVTTAISKLDKDVLASAPRANIGAALQGTVPGLQVTNATGQPGAAPQILLRGGASINNPGSPLVVVDGVIRSYNDISAEDIASVELLKDAASTAI